MAQFQRPNPWDPGYATPNYVYGEPPGRGTLTTRGLPRGTIDTANAHQTQANYAVPGFVLAETQGRGAYDTVGLPRRWVDTKTPDDLTRPWPNQRGSLSGTVFSKKTLSGSSLGDVAAYGRARQDPFRRYGIWAAEWLEKHIIKNPRLSPAEKKRALREILNGIDPTLLRTIEEKTEAFRLQGHPVAVAFKMAMAAALANGLADDVVRRGRAHLGLGDVPRMFKRGLRPALGATETATDKKAEVEIAGMKITVTVKPSGEIYGERGYSSSGGFQGLHLPRELDQAFRDVYEKWYKLQGAPYVGEVATTIIRNLMLGKVPVMKFKIPAATGLFKGVPILQHAVYINVGTTNLDAIKKAVVTVKRYVPPERNIIERGVGTLTSLVTAPFKLIKELPSIIGKVPGLVVDAVSTLAGKACDLVSSDAGTIAAGTTGAIYGGAEGAQAGVLGAQVASGICARGGGGGGPPVVEAPSILPWVLAGGGALLIVLAVAK